MSRCAKCGNVVSNVKHSFAGYGWYEVYCPECCPIERDGTICKEDHQNEVQKEKQGRLIEIEDAEYGGSDIVTLTLSRQELIDLVDKQPELLNTIVEQIGFDPRDKSVAVAVSLSVPFARDVRILKLEGAEDDET